MQGTWIALAQALMGVVGFGLLLLPPGFLVAYGTNFNGFRDRSGVEKMLWSLCLSLPLSIQVCVLGGRVLPREAILAVILLLSGAAATCIVYGRWGTRIAWHSLWRRDGTFAVVLLALGLGLYFVVAVTDVQIGHRLYVSTVIYDWAVRVPMVGAAMRSGVPPINGLSALAAQPAALRYFYFWYVVCADVAAMLHLPARASLTASCVWAGWTMLAAFFLALKYVVGMRKNLRRLCAVTFVILSVMGLDLLPTMQVLLMRNLHPHAEMEWWRQDRTPSFLGTCSYSPHHMAAMACLLTGLIVVVLTLRVPGRALGTGQLVMSSALAGVCFASAAGSSIFATLVVTIVCVVWVLDLAKERQLSTVAVLAGSALTAFALAGSFLRELQDTGGAVSGSFVSLHWRSQIFVTYIESRHHLVSSRPLVSFALIQGGMLIMDFFELGFFFFVLVHRVRRDARRTLTPAERALWAFFFGIAIAFLWLSSASIASPNDLGFDAGFLLRLVLQLWAVPWVYRLWQDMRAGRLFSGSPVRRIGLGLAAACFLVGLAGGIFQVVWERVYFPLVGSQTLRKQIDVLTTDRLSERLYNIREAYGEMDRLPGAAPAGASIQYNPVSPMQPALTYFSTHQIAAFDVGCGTGYGGDYARCKAIMPGLLALYGNTYGGVERGRAGNDRQDGAGGTASAADAEAACRELHLTALIAESLDTMWGRPQSWVWTMRPVVANETVRVFRCPE